MHQAAFFLLFSLSVLQEGFPSFYDDDSDVSLSESSDAVAQVEIWSGLARTIGVPCDDDGSIAVAYSEAS